MLWPAEKEIKALFMAVEKWMRMKCSHYGDSVKRALSLVNSC